MPWSWAKLIGLPLQAQATHHQPLALIVHPDEHLVDDVSPTPKKFMGVELVLYCKKSAGIREGQREKTISPWWQGWQCLPPRRSINTDWPHMPRVPQMRTDTPSLLISYHGPSLPSLPSLPPGQGSPPEYNRIPGCGSPSTGYRALRSCNWWPYGYKPACHSFPLIDS